MNYYPEPIRRLIRSFSKLPGIGEKTAERLTMHVLKAPRSEAEHLARHLIEMKEKIRLCSVCFGLSEGETCALCSNQGRDHTLICVVEQPADMIAIEKSGAYHGVYHILQGALSPIDGIGPDNLRIAELLQRIRAQKVAELILATSTSLEGESTAAYLKEILQGASIRITRIASGVPMGGDLKYVDQVTLKRAMDSRHAI